MKPLVLLSTLAALAGPAFAGPTLPNAYKLPGKNPTPIVYPTCPGGFTLSQKGAHIFRCKAKVPAIEAHNYVFYAVNTQCQPQPYWSGPSVAVQEQGANVTVTWTCKHTN